MNRRTFVFLLAAGGLVSAGGAYRLFEPSPARGEEVVVYKDPNCGCCGQWVRHLEASGFQVTVHDTDNLDSLKDQLGVPTALRSCHTAKIGPFIIEGHVPANDIARLLLNRPDARGIAVPGMPVGSPGMEQGDQRQPYDVIMFQADGRQALFASH